MIRKRSFTVILAFVVFFVSFCTLLTSDVFAAGSTRRYRVYDANTAAYKRTYTLTTEPNNNISAYNVFGVDTREIDWTKSGVVKINTTGGFGTGFVVDKHVIATAAHLLVTSGSLEKRRITSIEMFDASDSSEPDRNATFIPTPVEYHIPVEFEASNSVIYDEKHDYALITVEEDLSQYMCFSLANPLDMFTSVNGQNRSGSVMITGFPKTTSNVPNANRGNNGACTGMGSISSMNSEYLRYTIDTSGGNSGGPIYIREVVGDNVYLTVIGIHTTSYDNGENAGIRMTPDVLKFYGVNPNIIY